MTGVQTCALPISLSDVWGDSAVLLYRNPSLGKRTMDFGRTLVYRNLNTRTYREERSLSTWVDTDWDYGMQWMAVDGVSSGLGTAGYLITNVHS